MMNRPLITILVVFAGGILVAHKCLFFFQGLILPLFLLIAVCLLTIILIQNRSRIPCLLVIFFLTGIFLDINQHRPSHLSSFALRNERVTIEGTVLEPIKIVKETAKTKIHAHRLFIEGQTKPLNEKIVLTVYSHVPDLRLGQKIRFPARLKPFKNFNNPGGYDYESAMKLNGLACAASVSDGRYILLMGPGQLPFHRELMNKVQHPIREFFRQHLSVENNALYGAMILGERQGIRNELREPFNRTGLGHVLAVSGLHIGLVAWVAFFLLKWGFSRSPALLLRTDIRKPVALLTCLPVLAYVFVAGFQVSSQRAAIMALVFLFSLILGREKEMWSTLSLAGLIILAIDPHALFSMSFQLSFSAVVGILWLMPSILNKIPGLKNPQQRTILKGLYAYFLGLVAVCLSATLFLLPLTIIFFHQIALVAVPANIMVVPILGLWVIPLGLVSAMVLPFSVGAADFFLHLGAWGLDVMMGIIRFWSSVPGSSIWMVTPNVLETLLYYGAVFFLFFLKGRTWAKVGALAVMVLLLADVGYWINKVRFNGELRVSYIDVGQANAAMVEFPGGKRMMIDGGGFPGDRFDVGRMVVAPYLWQAKILKIHYLVLSHPQSDHLNGLRFIAKAFDPEEIWHNGDDVKIPSHMKLMDIVDEKKIRKYLPSDLVKGRTINGAKVQMLHPKPEASAFGDVKNGAGLNNNSLVLKISYCEKSFLFPGDLEVAGEAHLASNAGELVKSHVLLSPHHGSKSSSSMTFLKAVKPRICVISCGESNFFGFPHEQTIRRLEQLGTQIIRIDEVGAVKFTVGPNRFEIDTFLSSTN